MWQAQPALEVDWSPFRRLSNQWRLTLKLAVTICRCSLLQLHPFSPSMHRASKACLCCVRVSVGPLTSATHPHAFNSAATALHGLPRALVRPLIPEAFHE